MNSVITRTRKAPAFRAALPDPDLLAQARPGHGVPSQDPNPEAQFALAPAEARREADSALTGAGAVVGAATGAALGGLLAGPVGVLVGTTLGAAAGALGGAAAGASGGNPLQLSRREH